MTNTPGWLGWLTHYRRSLLAGDISAGVVVAMMMIPQGMAYAMVAGLPPVAGIYASILPPLLYALFGSSMTQSVGPMAIVALMTAAALVWEFGQFESHRKRVWMKKRET